MQAGVCSDGVHASGVAGAQVAAGRGWAAADGVHSGDTASQTDLCRVYLSLLEKRVDETLKEKREKGRYKFLFGSLLLFSLSVSFCSLFCESLSLVSIFPSVSVSPPLSHSLTLSTYLQVYVCQL